MTLPLSNANKKESSAMRSTSFKINDSKPPTIKSVANLTPLGGIRSEVLMSAVSYSAKTGKPLTSTPKIQNVTRLNSHK